MPDYKLIYFNMRGLAEPIRWLFQHGGIEFTDERVEKDDWPAMKESIPGGKLPVLMIDDKPLIQSHAIARLVAAEAGLMPEDPMDQAHCDAAVDTVRDIMVPIFAKMREEEDEDARKTWFRETFCPECLVPFLEQYDKCLADREWLVTDKVTWADFMVSHALGELRAHHPEAFEEYSNVCNHIDRVRDLQAIKEWIANRPDTTH